LIGASTHAETTASRTTRPASLLASTLSRSPHAMQWAMASCSKPLPLSAIANAPPAAVWSGTLYRPTVLLLTHAPMYMMAAENGGSQQAGAVGVAAPYTYADGPLAGAQCALGRQATGPPVLLGPSLSLCLVLRASAVSIPSSVPPEKPAIPPRLASCHPPFSCSPTISSAQSSGLLRLNFDTCTRDQITATSNFIFERPCS
jgi:hypothetical protein